MKRFLVGSVAVLGLSSAALADTYVGARVGYPGLGAQFGVSDALLPGLGFRLRATALPFSAGGPGFGGGLDLLFTIPVGLLGVSPYVGAGAAFTYAPATAGAAPQFQVGAEAVGGAEFRPFPFLGVFAEVTPGVTFSPSFAFSGFGVAAGVNLHF